ncbi:MAG TPA: DUF1707 domain-containing protein [Acidimicrobiales bacterium]|nr:DUF1707 domain-containing protein [Acidimicrobiales bacterium]
MHPERHRQDSAGEGGPPRAAWWAWLAHSFWYASSTRPRSVPGSAPDLRGFAGSGVRASDAERSEVADLLSRHFGEGRLDGAELDERLGRAMSARTRGDLALLVADLPALDLPAAEPPVAPGRRLITSQLVGALLVVVAATGLLLAVASSSLGGFGVIMVVFAAVAGRRHRRERAFQRWHDDLHSHGVAHWHGPSGPVVEPRPPWQGPPPFTS